jgi:hypothetical protein
MRKNMYLKKGCKGWDAVRFIHQFGLETEINYPWQKFRHYA